MTCYRPIFFVFIACICFGYCEAQEDYIGKLKQNIYAAKDEPSRLNALLEFCNQWDSYHPDTLKKYAELTQQLAIQQKNKNAELQAHYFMALWLLQTNKLDTAFAVTDEVTNSYQKKFPYDEMYVKLFGLKSNLLLRTGKMKELLAASYDFIKLAEQQHDTLGVARATIGIGNVDLRMKKYEESIQTYHQALGLMNNPLLKGKLSFVFNNMAIDFYHLSKEDSSLFYVNEGLKYSRKDGNLTNLANAYFLYGGMLAEFKHLKEAEEAFKQAIEERKKIGDIYYLINDMAQFALFYADNKNPEKGIALCKEGLQLAEKNGISVANLNDLYEALSKNYLAAADYKNYSETLQKLMEIKDSSYQKNSAEALAELQTKYEVQKKENIITQQRLNLTKKNYLFYGLLALIVFALILVIILFSGYKKRQKLKMNMIMEREKLLAKQSVAEAEENERRRIAADLHDNLGAHASVILSNAEELKNLSSSEKEILDNLKLNASEIMTNLRDTIWALSKERITVTGISDRIKNYIQKLQPAFPSKQIRVKEAIQENHLLSPSLALNMFRIVQEAMHNSLKHSQADKIEISVESNHTVKIIVADNGKGFSGLGKQTGHGLQNMKTRAAEANLDLSIENNQPSGSKTIVTSTIRQNPINTN
jgi:signal transduction histidine kinase